MEIRFQLQVVLHARKCTNEYEWFVIVSVHMSSTKMCASC